MRRSLLVAALVIGLGLVAAPVAFQMFSRAPEGGDMLDDFREYMDADTVDRFQGYMAQIDAAEAELREALPPLLSSEAGVAPADAEARFANLASFHEQWPAIEADMSDDMLVTIERMVPNFQAVDALPPFDLFPWFFVAPGVLVAVVAAVALIRAGRGRSVRPLAFVLVALGVGLVLAPAVFQMFSRAPDGKEMIDEFRPLMTRERVTTIQGYFLEIGAAEGEVRTQVRPLLEESGVTAERWAAELPAADAFNRDWPTISNEFAPMIGAMSDNVDNYEAIDALPPFSLFPWFFVVPGLLVAGLGLAASRPAGNGHADVGDTPRLERRQT